MKNKKVILGFISLGLLLLGLIFYLLLNEDAFVSKIVFDIIPIQSFSESNNAFVKVLRNFGADFLWSVSFTMIIQIILWLDKKKTFFLLFCSLLGIIYELMQCFGVAAGTADILDMIVYVMGSLFAIIIIQGGKLYEEK